MTTLTPDDVKRWDVSAIRRVFHVATSRAGTLQRLGDDLQDIDDQLSQWDGAGGDAFRSALGKSRTDIEADGRESMRVAKAVRRAEYDISGAKAELDNVEEQAASYGWTVTPGWQIDVGGNWIGMDPVTVAALRQLLQVELDQAKAHAYAADQDLAVALRAAVGETQVDDTGHDIGPPQAPPDGYTPVTVDQLRQIVPGLSQAKAAEIVGPLNEAMRQGGMNTPQRQAAFISQVAVESDNFNSFVEYADGSEYEGRTDLGNTQPGDGPRYKGRGAIQVTGRANYARMSQDLGVDFINHPELAATPQYAFKTALWYWNTHDGNAIADTGNIVKVTEMVNGGHHALAERTEYYNRGLQVLGR